MSPQKREELVQAEWARALYEALCRYQDTPLFAEVAAEMGNPLAVERLAAG